MKDILRINNKEVTLEPPYVSDRSQILDDFECRLCGHYVETLWYVRLDPNGFGLTQPSRTVLACEDCIRRWSTEGDEANDWYLDLRAQKR